MSLRTIARALGGQVIGDQVLAPGPAHSRHDRSLTVWIDTNASDGFRCHSFAGDDWRKCRDYVRERLGLPDWQPSASKISAPRPRRVIAAQITDTEHDGADRERIQRAMVLWKEAANPCGTLVERYLQHRRISLPKDVLAADALRFHPSCPFRLDDGSTARIPAMLALMRDIRTGEPRAIHRTALKEDGNGKVDLPGLGNAKKMLGVAKNAVIKLTADDSVVDGLGIAEGIETALTLLCADWSPVWACGTAGAIEHFPVLPGIECLTIFADADRAGMAAAEKCQEQWNAAGQECRILAAPNAGSDWNDIVRAAA
jgi:putative DNA primase/helicase